jgi:hypothetical protein
MNSGTMHARVLDPQAHPLNVNLTELAMLAYLMDREKIERVNWKEPSHCSDLFRLHPQKLAAKYGVTHWTIRNWKKRAMLKIAVA